MTSTDECECLPCTVDEFINKLDDEHKKDASTGTEDNVIKILLEQINRLQENIKKLDLRYTHVVFRYESVSQNNHIMKAVIGITKETYCYFSVVKFER